MKSPITIPGKVGGGKKQGGWWRWCCRAAKPVARMEAATSCSWLLAGVGRAVRHAGPAMLYLTPMLASKDKLMAFINTVRHHSV